MTIIAAMMILIARTDIQNPYFVMMLVAPTIGFWFLDGYFLQMESIFRAIYNDIRVQSDTNFEMNMDKHKHKPEYKLSSTLFSLHTCCILYGRDCFDCQHVSCRL